MSETEPQAVGGPVIVLLGFLGVGAGAFFAYQLAVGLSEQSLTAVLASLGALILIGVTLAAVLGAPRSPAQVQPTKDQTSGGTGEEADGSG